MILKVKDENGQFKEVVLKGLKGERGERGERGEDGTVLQQKEIDGIKSSLEHIATNVFNHGVFADGELIQHTYTVIERDTPSTLKPNGKIMWSLNGKKWSGTNQLSKIQAVLDLGGSIFFPKGNYYIEGSLFITKPNTRIYGAGIHQTVLCGNFRFFIRNEATNFKIHDLDLVGKGDKLPPPVKMGDSNSSLSDQTIFNWNYMYDIGYSNYNAIEYETPTAYGNIDGITIENVYCSMYHSLLGGGANDRVYPRAKNIRVYNCTTEYMIWHGVSGRHMENVDVDNCNFNYHFIGMGCDFSSGSYNATMRNCECYKTSNLCKMEKTPYSDVSSRLYVYNNVFTSFDNSDVGYDDSYIIRPNCTEAEIKNNTLYVNKWFPNFIESTSNYITIENNNIYANISKNKGFDIKIIKIDTQNTIQCLKTIRNNNIDVSNSTTTDQIIFLLNNGFEGLLKDNLNITGNNIIGELTIFIKQIGGNLNYAIDKFEINNNVFNAPTLIYSDSAKCNITTLNIENNKGVVVNRSSHYHSFINIKFLESERVVIKGNYYQPKSANTEYSQNNFIKIDNTTQTINNIEIKDNKAINITVGGVVIANISSISSPINVNSLKILNNDIKMNGLGTSWALGVSINIKGTLEIDRNTIDCSVVNNANATLISVPINFYNSNVYYNNNDVTGNAYIQGFTNQYKIKQNIAGDFKMISSKPAWYDGTKWVRADGTLAI